MTIRRKVEIEKEIAEGCLKQCNDEIERIKNSHLEDKNELLDLYYTLKTRYIEKIKFLEDLLNYE